MALANEGAMDLHYSAALTLSRDDTARFKDKLIGFVREFLGEVSQSPEQEAYAFSLDFFSLRK